MLQCQDRVMESKSSLKPVKALVFLLEGIDDCFKGILKFTIIFQMTINLLIIYHIVVFFLVFNVI